VILICSVIRTHQHRRDLSRGTHGLIKLALALKDRPARLLQGIDDTDVDERKMKHDGPKTTTTTVTTPGQCTHLTTREEDQETQVKTSIHTTALASLSYSTQLLHIV
jgi:hypothetical protein